MAVYQVDEGKRLRETGQAIGKAMGDAKTGMDAMKKRKADATAQKLLDGKGDVTTGKKSENPIPIPGKQSALPTIKPSVSVTAPSFATKFGSTGVTKAPKSASIPQKASLGMGSIGTNLKPMPPLADN